MKRSTETKSSQQDADHFPPEVSLLLAIFSLEVWRFQIDTVLATLTPFEREVIKMRYGLSEGPRSVEEVAGVFKIHSPRVRQIEAKAIRKLQYPEQLLMLVGLVPKPLKLPVPPAAKELLTQPISVLNLSIKVHTSLTRMGIVTLSNLVGKSETDLLIGRNFGFFAACEVESKLQALGLCLAEEHVQY